LTKGFISSAIDQNVKERRNDFEGMFQGRGGRSLATCLHRYLISRPHISVESSLQGRERDRQPYGQLMLSDRRRPPFLSSPEFVGWMHLVVMRKYASELMRRVETPDL
jgi:hypothetical protein